jgi:hypothetical protein
MAGGKKSPATQLVDARAALAAVEAKVAERERDRQARLLAGDPAAEIAVLDAELTGLRDEARIESDRIKLLVEAVQQEENAAALKRRANLIDRFERKLAEADALAAELQDDLAKVEKKFRRIIALREDARAAFAVQSSHANAAAGAIEGCAMAGPAVKALLSYELYRVSARPVLGGTPGAFSQASLPGALSPRLELQMRPEGILPFADALRADSAFAVDLLKKELTIPPAGPAASPPLSANGHAAPIEVAATVVAPAPEIANGDLTPRERTEAESRLAQLLVLQDKAAEDVTPEGEARYQQIVAEIAGVTAQIEAERSNQHG